MNTGDIADVLDITAKLMELHEENTFKIKALAAAAYKLSKTRMDLAGKTQEEISQIEGVGKGISAKIMEYMSCENAIVSFDLLESRRSAGEAAIYVERDDARLFGDAIIALLDDPTERKRRAQVGYQRLRADLHWGRSKEALLNAYRIMLSPARISMGSTQRCEGGQVRR